MGVPSLSDYDHVQNYGEMTRDIGKALQKSRTCAGSCRYRAASWHGKCTDQSTMRRMAQPGGFRRHHVRSGKSPRDAAQLTHEPSFMQKLHKELDTNHLAPFSHHRSWITLHSAHKEAVKTRKDSKKPSDTLVNCAVPDATNSGLQQTTQDSDTAKANERDGWMALIALCMCSSFNAFMCMNFSANEAATVSALGISEEDTAQLYSFYLVTCLIGMTPSMWLSDRHEAVSLRSGVCATIAAAWIRWWGLRSQSIGLCLVSQVLVGYGACPVSTLPGKISHQRFGPGLRALTTSLMVQANYSGWLLGSSVPALLVVEGSAESLVSFAFMQCIYSVFVALAYFLLYRPPPAAALAEDAATTSHVRGFVQILKAMWSKPQFTIQLITHGCLGGIGFAVPSAIFFILADLGCPSFVGPLTNIAFIGTGVSAGICFGYFCTDPKSYARILKLCYVSCAVSLLACSAVVSSGFFGQIGVSVALIFLAAVAGFAALGFTGIAFEDLALFPDIPASYVIWIGYIFILGIAEPLNDMSADSQGFKTLGCVASGACVVFLVTYRQGGVSTHYSGSSSSGSLSSSSSSSSLTEPLLLSDSIP